MNQPAINHEGTRLGNDCAFIQVACGRQSNLVSVTMQRHAEYCARYGMDYLLSVYPESDYQDYLGYVFEKLLAAVRAGYRYIVFCDSDALVVGDRNLREACPFDGFGATWHDMADWGDPRLYDHWNLGMLYVGAGERAVAFLKEWSAADRTQHPWVAQHVFNQTVPIDLVTTLGHEWNCTPVHSAPDPVVLAWHGIGSVEDKFLMMQDALYTYTGPGSALEKAEVLVRKGRYHAAAALYSLYLQHEPTDVLALKHLAHCLAAMKRWDQASTMLQVCVHLEPENADAWRMLGGALTFLGEHEASGDALSRADALAPNAPATRLNLAFWDLKDGNWHNGFDGLRWDFVAGGRKLRVVGREWDRMPVGTLFVWGEQGIGDVLMFYRFLPFILKWELAQRVVLEVPSALLPLLSGQDERITVFAQPADASVPLAYDAQCGSFDLPRLLCVTPEKVGPMYPVPYINAPVEKWEQWKERIAPRLTPRTDLSEEEIASFRAAFEANCKPGKAVPMTRPFRVGFSWAGNRSHPNDCHRSLPPEAFDALVATPGISFYSLQRDVEIPESVRQTTPQMAWIGGEIEDMADTAGILAHMNLVITVDSAVAHLAGAMGLPCWILLSKSSDWRWLKDGETTCWYPSVRLFRQRSLGEWDDVMARVQDALREEIEAWQKR